ncbi:MAG: acyltransferase [Christensenellaceae bacterium]
MGVELCEHKAQATRICWVDTFKFLAMIYIYVGHLGTGSGRMYAYVWTFHMAMFFFAAGIFANKSKQVTTKEFVKKQFCRLLIPYYFFSAMSIVLGLLEEEIMPGELPQNILRCLLGVKELYNASLWFLPSLFMVTLFHYFAKKIMHKDVFVFLFSIALYMVSLRYFSAYENIPMCANFSTTYMVYYSSGAMLGRLVIRAKRDHPQRLISKVTIAGASIAALVYLVCFYLGKDLMSFIQFPTFGLLGLLKCLILIGGNIIIAMLLSPVASFAGHGQNTLYMCGNELFIKKSAALLLSTLGLSVQPAGALGCILYCVLLLVLVEKILMPIEKPMIDAMTNLFHKAFKKKQAS